MGEQSKAYFDQANRLGGLVAKMQLASLAQLTSTEASSVEDSPEIVARLERAMTRLRREFESNSAEGKASPALKRSVRPEADEVRLLRRQLQIYVELMTQRRLFLGDVNATVRRIDEAASTAIDVERVSVWYLDDKRSKIRCADLFVRSTREHSSGVELFAKDFAPYFGALQSERTIAAHDAHKDPRTSCFSASYLTPLGINSMLDVPIWVGEKMVGVVCHEHVGPARTWNVDEETFAYLMSNFVSLALEQSAKPPR